MKKNVRILLNSFLFSAIGISAQAAGSFEISYDFTGTIVADPTTEIGSVSSDSAVWIGYTDTYGFSGASDTAYVNSLETDSSVNLDQYLTITITPTVEGELLYLDTLTFTLGASNSGENDFTISAQVQAGETDSDFSTLSDFILISESTTVATHEALSTISGNAYTSYSVDLSGDEYQGLESLALRIYIYDDANTGTVIDRIDSIVVTGSTAIPEPATAGLLIGTLILSMVTLRRRRA
jgi:hypothetical protein